METIILNLIKLQNQLRILHWQTSKYAEHKALGSAYDDLDDYIDELVEVHQGKHGKMKFSSPSLIDLANYEDLSIMDILEEVTAYLSSDFNNALDIAKDTDCMNIRDSILSVLNKLKYLLTLS